MRLVLDTNIYLAAMGRRGICFDLFIKLIQEKQFELFVSPEILSELTDKIEILIRKKLIGRDSASRILFMAELRSITVKPKEKAVITLRDKNDKHILECALESQAHLILTMDQDLIKLKSFKGIGIIHPKTFLYIFPQS